MYYLLLRAQLYKESGGGGGSASGPGSTSSAGQKAAAWHACVAHYQADPIAGAEIHVKRPNPPPMCVAACVPSTLTSTCRRVFGALDRTPPMPTSPSRGRARFRYQGRHLAAPSAGGPCLLSEGQF